MSTAAGGWSSHFTGLMHDLGVHIPDAWSQAPCTFAYTVFESMGTLLAFAMICAGMMYLRIGQPELPRAFKTPLWWLAAPLGMASCVHLIASLPVATFWRSLTSVGSVWTAGEGLSLWRAQPLRTGTHGAAR